MVYVDCYLAPVALENRAAYEELARISAQIVREHGALRVVECWVDHAGPEASNYHGTSARLESSEYAGFLGAAGAGEGETVVLSYVEWPSKAVRDEGMAKVTSDSRMQFEGLQPAFDGRRLIAAGFTPMVYASSET